MSVRGYHVLLVLAVVCLVAGSGAFSSVTADRGMTVAVVDDENAYLGVDQPGAAAALADLEDPEDDDRADDDDSDDNDESDDADDDGDEDGDTDEEERDEQSTVVTESVPVLVVTNQFDVPVTVEVLDVRVVDQPDGGPELSGPSETLALGVGESDEFTTTVTCGTTSGTTTVELDLLATGEGVRVELTREVTVTCS